MATAEKIKDRSKSNPVFLRMDESLKHRLRHQSERLNISMNAVCTMAVIKYLEEEEKNESKSSR